MSLFTTTYNCTYLFHTYISKEAFVAISVIVLIILVKKIGINFAEKASLIGLVLVVLGGCLNLLEWWLDGCVKDYINFFGLFTFNLNDLLITLGLILLWIQIWKKR